uniref:Si:ch211-111e20.1 n=1 Tax=Salarias fasciatus TaxID=181472 RepID=A0A672FUM3_SALFA
MTSLIITLYQSMHCVTCQLLFHTILSSRQTAMVTLMDELKEVLLKALPNLSEDVQELLIERLISSDLESKDDLRYVKQDDIADLLPVIQQRKLLDAFKLASSQFSTPSTSSPAPSCSASNVTEDSQPSSHMQKTWPESFQVPWNLMPADIHSAISDGKRPSPAARRQMIRVIADEMRKNEANRTRSQCLTVCRNIVRQYPNSFADQLDNGQLLGSGYTSLLIEVKNRIENLNRTSSFRQHRSTGSGNKRGPTDTYGCTRFQPSLPPDETEDTVENKRLNLQEIYSREGLNGADRAEIKQLMETTFYLQRCHINVLPAPAMEDLKTKWPYLFSQRGLYCHFELLTDIPILRTLELLSYCVLQLLMAHFSENITDLILLTDVSFLFMYTYYRLSYNDSFYNSTISDIERSINIPETPRLILLGIQTTLLTKLGIQPTFLTGLAAMFSTFYIFNLQYQEEAACTLEFIQRRFIGINPERGSKTARGKVVSKKTGKAAAKKSATVNPHVSTLLKKLMDFEWDFI